MWMISFKGQRSNAKKRASVGPMIEWRPWEYFPVSNNLSLEDSTSEVSDSWRGGIRSVEATVETLLMFNLSTLVGIPLRALRRAYAMESSADMIATDPLGRIHLFELKKGSVSGQAAQQLEQYLLEYVFSDPDEFLAAVERSGRRQTSTFHLARDIMGVQANRRIETVGYKTIVRELGSHHELLVRPSGRSLTRYGYGHLDESEHLAILHTALDRSCQRRGFGPPPPIDVIQGYAVEWSRKLRGQLGKSQGPLVADQRLVIWLVGTSISPAALERVRLWRREGLDARVLRATARNDGSSWVLGVRRERTSERDAVEAEILAMAQKPTQPPGNVKLSFYSQESASTDLSKGGGLLSDPVAEISGLS